MTAPTMTSSTNRLLGGYLATGRPADLGVHLATHGPQPRYGEEFIRLVEEAGLTGRGGAAFPTATKLRAVARNTGRRPGIVIANGGESEPASGKDRLLLSVAPHLVLDGATLAAEAVGAREIIICVHAGGDVGTDVEWAVAEREQAGLATVPISVCRIPDRYVASEETSLVNWINNGRAVPMYTPPRPFERGVNGRPTLIDNVETLAHLALIARYGAAWFRSCGDSEAPGTALFTVSGAVASPGVCEAPLGGSIADLIAAAGGPAEPLQAVLLGGYGGTWLSVRQLTTRTTRSDLAAVRAALGPGIVVALPSRACGIAETARVLGYLAEQSARQCGPCMFGLPAIAEDFAAVAACAADPSVYARLRGRLGVLAGRGACRHPDGAVRLAESALRVFADHLTAHERAGGCLSARRPGVLDPPTR
jgi:NADH:ubiquinone oxidoreductase subunit F (NADH-binding)